MAAKTSKVFSSSYTAPKVTATECYCFPSLEQGGVGGGDGGWRGRLCLFNNTTWIVWPQLGPDHSGTMIYQSHFFIEQSFEMSSPPFYLLLGNPLVRQKLVQP